MFLREIDVNNLLVSNVADGQCFCTFMELKG